jgi:hypothetical protein
MGSPLPLTQAGPQRPTKLCFVGRLAQGERGEELLLLVATVGSPAGRGSVRENLGSPSL